MPNLAMEQGDLVSKQKRTGGSVRVKTPTLLDHSFASFPSRPIELMF